MGDLRIRPAERGDAAALARVQVASWRRNFRGLLSDEYLDQTVDEEHRTGDWERLLDRLPETRGTVLVGERDDGVLGFAHVGPTDDEDLEGGAIGELYALHVLPETQRTGVGSALLDAATERLQAEGFEVGVLWVLSANEPARRLYEGRGWEADGASKRFADAQEVRYRRRLSR